MGTGYFTQPSLCADRIVFVCEDDLWEVDSSGGQARRLTNSRSEIKTPYLDPSGKWIACCAKEEGDPDVYLMSADGGPLTRLTWLNSVTRIVGWTPDGSSILFHSIHQAVHHRGSDAWLFKVGVDGGPVQRLPFGPAVSLNHQQKGPGIVLARNSMNNSRWKRYRGGMVGEIWVDEQGKGNFQRILNDLEGNPVCPYWLGKRIWFVSDHEGIGNLYSCTPKGKDLQRESFQQEYYVRDPAFSGNQLVYHCGGDLWKLDTSASTKREQHIPIEFQSSRSRIQRRFIYGDSHLEDGVLHPAGHEVAILARGKLFSMPHWEQEVRQFGQRHGVRYRLPCWLSDGRLAAISDDSAPQKKNKSASIQGGEERLDVFALDPSEQPEKSYTLPVGRIQQMVNSPRHPHLVFTTSRMELHLINLSSGRTLKLDSSRVREISDPVFSPDGSWLAYTKHLSLELTAIFLVALNPDNEGKKLKPGKPFQITEPVRYDFAPCFDPEGRFLYFLSARIFNPIWDTVQTGTTFSRSIKPYLLTLQEGTSNPFLPHPHAPGGTEASQSSQEERGAASEAGETDKAKNKSEAQPSRTPQLRIDLEGIRERIVEFPVPEGLYEQVLGLPNKVLFTETPLLGAIHGEGVEPEDNNQGVLWVYDFEKQEKEVIAHEVDQVEVNPAGKTMLYFSGNQIRILEAGVPVPDESESDGSPSRKSGWLDLSRVRIAINYQDEWSQMFREAWRLQKEFFWNEQLSGVDWNAVYRRYENLLSRIGSRSELSDLIWEMQGELGTSHAYEYGGDYPFSPQYPVGQLGADLEYEPSRKAWVFRKIYRGDIWRVHQHSPLAEPGQQVQENDLLLEIGGVPLDGSTSPGELLVHQAGQAVQLTVKTPGKKESKRKIIVKTLIHEGKTRYREWVKQNLKFVEAQSEGRVGYLHIPDMDTEGIAEFHRGFLSQVDREGLIIDARFNAGGWVSPLVLEKLTHRHLGYDVPRWGSPESYPYHTLRGHLVLITNQFTGSDGDMFTASFKQLKLGKVIGKRTWGGVVGIDGRYQLVDGTTTTQPQYSIWFHHAGWSVENYGVDPDLVVEDPPQSYSNGMDHQLKQAVEVIQKIIEEDPLPKIQDFKSNSR